MNKIGSHIFLLIVAGATAVLIACDSHADAVCENTGACSQGGDGDWIDGCKAEAKGLEHEAARSSCTADFNGYYACADDHYVCRGATASFPGCDKARAALTVCLARSREHTACAMLRTRRAECASVAADGGALADMGPNLDQGCDLNQECQARCFLDSTSDPCVEKPDELAAFSKCAESCPP
jgi:hypothetical protein